jgi:hypothetical protein
VTFVRIGDCWRTARGVPRRQGPRRPINVSPNPPGCCDRRHSGIVSFGDALLVGSTDAHRVEPASESQYPGAVSDPSSTNEATEPEGDEDADAISASLSTPSTLERLSEEAD